MSEADKSNDVIGNELQRLATDGLLTAEAVVESARATSSPLHSMFLWDDTEAAHQFRLMQARQLIVSVRIIHPQAKESIQAFVSLSPDRSRPGGGYRSTIDVLRRKSTREILIGDAMNELRRIEHKYRHITELCDIWEAIRKR